MSPKWMRPSGTEKEFGRRPYVSGKEKGYTDMMKETTDKATLDERPFHLSEFKKPYRADNFFHMEHAHSPSQAEMGAGEGPGEGPAPDKNTVNLALAWNNMLPLTTIEPGATEYIAVKNNIGMCHWTFDMGGLESGYLTPTVLKANYDHGRFEYDSNELVVQLEATRTAAGSFKIMVTDSRKTHNKTLSKTVNIPTPAMYWCYCVKEDGTRGWPEMVVAWTPEDGFIDSTYMPYSIFEMEYNGSAMEEMSLESMSDVACYDDVQLVKNDNWSYLLDPPSSPGPIRFGHDIQWSNNQTYDHPTVMTPKFSGNWASEYLDTIANVNLYVVTSTRTGGNNQQTRARGYYGVPCTNYGNPMCNTEESIYNDTNWSYIYESNTNESQEFDEYNVPVSMSSSTIVSCTVVSYCSLVFGGITIVFPSATTVQALTVNEQGPIGDTTISRSLTCQTSGNYTCINQIGRFTDDNIVCATQGRYFDTYNSSDAESIVFRPWELLHDYESADDSLWQDSIMAVYINGTRYTESPSRVRNEIGEKLISNTEHYASFQFVFKTPKAE
jgi:hypothetical protein